ncbi:sulfite oxidase heme-binding subunit YedZ [Zavarzinia compransoris]|uniref:Protein-methionine-sulfoxide reductase heme-binding subunit MsrQ n=1 Tax=Zavarzinia compransoris TaxID=1264899 RepID=A0A317EBL8_9PROT|nr:ferric reductase-like transmembrane domain-containing protein [Zavarzinia compransoris]PWR23646.1 sulfoxide reductase heme-binding subunit YedZ [Zavarzinia compransoris]
MTPVSASPAASLPWPWLDRRGRLSAVKLAMLAGLVAPALVLALRWASGDLMPRPFDTAIHETGLWGMRFLLLSLALTPLRRGGDLAGLVLIRRMVGVGAFCWLALHFFLYVGDQAFDLGLVAAEIVKRFYLMFGFIALFGLCLLAATSTDGMVRRLGARRWRALHRLTYGIGILGAVHFFMQSKADPGEATIAAGLLVWAFARRLWPGRGAWPVLLLPVLAALGAALAEALYFLGIRGIDPTLVLLANLDLAFGPRPALWSGLAVLGVELALLLRRRSGGRQGPGGPRPAARRSGGSAA